MTAPESTGRGVDALILVALRVELKGIAKALKLRKRGGERYENEGGRVLAVCVGPGRNAEPRTRQWIETVRPRRVLHVGYCGGLGSSLSAGDAVRPARVVDDATGTEIALAQGEGVLVTTAEPVLTPAAKRELAHRREAAAVDTESYHVASACRGAGVPLEIVRAVTDTADEPLAREIVNLVDERGRTKPLAVARLVIRPHWIGTLRKLGRRSRSADATLAGCAQAFLEQQLPTHVEKHA
ncbi:MAG: hypothetical protein ACOC1G_02415 [Phycisphaeraceae bacterium]